jgi:hypothetical protein
MSTGNTKIIMFLGSKLRRVLMLTTLSPSVSRLSRLYGILNISQPYRAPWPVTGIALLFFTEYLPKLNKEFWGKPISCLPLMPHGSHGKRQTRIASKMTYTSDILFMLVFIAAGTCLPSRCLAPKVEISITEPLIYNSRRNTREP